MLSLTLYLSHAHTNMQAHRRGASHLLKSELLSAADATRLADMPLMQSVPQRNGRLGAGGPASWYDAWSCIKVRLAGCLASWHATGLHALIQASGKNFMYMGILEEWLGGRGVGQRYPLSWGVYRGTALSSTRQSHAHTYMPIIHTDTHQ